MTTVKHTSNDICISIFQLDVVKAQETGFTLFMVFHVFYTNIFRF